MSSATEDTFALLATLARRRLRVKQIDLMNALGFGRRKMNRAVNRLVDIGVPIHKRLEDGFVWLYLGEKDVSKWEWNVHV